MELQSLFLVLTGSLFHLGWNVLTKGAKDKLTFLWIAAIPASVMVLLFQYQSFEYSSEGLPYLLASVIIHGIYFWSLTATYKYADLSFVYPYARGTGTLLATIGGIALLREFPSFKGYIGIALTISAIFLEPIFTKNKKVEKKGLCLTALTGVMIATYSLIDKVGISFISPSLYLSVMFLCLSLLFLPYMLRNNRIKNEISHSTYKPFIASIFLYLAYFLVLEAMKVAPISYVVSARASGIIASGVTGIIFFQEEISKLRWLSIVMICIGIYFIGTA